MGHAQGAAVHGEQVIAGRYRLLEQVGAGGMGVVWCAADEETGTTVALKRALVSNEAGDRKVRREARLAAEVRHPNVVEFFGVAEDEGELWLVMEYVPSRSLSELLKSDGPLPVRRVNEIGVKLAGALDAVHGQGIVHRDVTPGNVLIAEDGRVKLTDFGISRSVATDETVTASPVVGGTPGYLAPEVAAGHEPTVASDVFSLGSTLYAASEGSAPFEAENAFATLSRAAAGDFRAPEKAAELTPVLAALMRVKPAERPSAAEAQKMLEACFEGKKIVLPHRPFWRRRVVLSAAVLVVVAGVVAGLMIALPRRTTQNTAATKPSTPTTSATPVSAAVGSDMRSVDLCGLTEPAPLGKFGQTEVDPDYGNFNRCDVLIHLGPDRFVDVKVELEVPPVADSPPEGPVTKVEKFDVVSGPVQDGECRRILDLPDRYLANITAVGHDAGPIDLCAIADTATLSAAKVLTNSGMPRRKAPAAPHSLSTLDACSLLDAATVTSAAKVVSPESKPDYGNWGCRWESDNSDNTVIVLFDRGEPPGSRDGKRVELSGRDAFVLADDYGDNTCQAKVLYRPYSDATGNEAAEVVTVVVAGEPPGSKLCAPVTALAGKVAEKLPKV